MNEIFDMQKELDLFIKDKQIIRLIEKMSIILPKKEASITLWKIYDDEDFIPELDKRVRKIETNYQYPLGEYIEKLIKDKNYKNYSDLSMRAGISKEYWHKITKGKIKNPSKAKLLCIAIALRLNLEETETLLRMAGYSFTKDLTVLESIIAFFIEKERYNIFDIDTQLERYGQPTIYSIK